MRKHLWHNEYYDLRNRRFTLPFEDVHWYVRMLPAAISKEQARIETLHANDENHIPLGHMPRSFTIAYLQELLRCTEHTASNLRQEP